MSEVNGNVDQSEGGEHSLGNGKGVMHNGHDSGEVIEPSADNDIDDPEILAAIAASKKDADEEIIAAIEASKKEAETDNEVSKNISDDKSENVCEEAVVKAPTVLINTMYKNNEPEDEVSGDENPEENPEEEDSGDPINEDPEDLNNEDPEDSNNADAEDPNNEDCEASDQIALEGEPEIGENPFDMSVDDTGNPLEEDSDADPLNGNTEGGENVEDNGFIEKINADNESEEEIPLSQLQARKPFKKKRANPVYITPVNKRKRSFSGNSSDEDDDEDEYVPGSKKAKKSKKKPAAKSRPKRSTATEVEFKCSICSFASETVGELVIHKYSSHKKQSKPSYLDLGEAAVVTLDNKQGSSKSEILKYILSAHSNVINDDKKSASKLLAVALAAGIELGRLRQGLLGRKNADNYWVVNKSERRKILERWKKNRALVEHRDDCAAAVGNIEEDSEEFNAIKEKLTKYNIQVTTAPKDVAPSIDSKNYGRGKRASKPITVGACISSLKDSSDDEICVLEEKITPKTKQKILQRKKMLAKGIVGKTVIRVNSNQGKQMLKKIASTGVVPTPTSSTNNSKFKDDDEEDIQLTCPVCLSCYWYPNQTHEHMKSVHNIENPEKFIIDRKRKV